ncbi:hypothetical protein HID58_014011 [Brassica napus]|uniref:DUF4283 domain-containing protein n=1 Tax=Brassica napus TaxID=3708 RepID=A0ABQ8DFY4_BRANA|nr:hypothetical protein HID58_014011 [Brassica napus]
MAGKPFRPPPRPPIPPDFGFPISDLPLNSQKFPPLLPHSPRSSLAPNKFSTMSSPWTLPSLPSSSFAPSALVDLSSPTTALSISTPSVTLAVEQTPITILGESETHGVSPLGIVQPVTNPEDKDTTMGEAPAFNPLDPSDLSSFPPLSQPPPSPLPNTSNQQPNTSPPPLPENWAKNLQKSTDKTLKKVSNPTFTPEGIPRIKIPDSVFKKGADLHQDFILGVFLGKTPSFSHIQSVLTHIWGRGMKLEIHLRPESRSMLVRIPNSTIRKKIVEQEFWHIGNVLFYVAQWSDSVAMQPPVFTSMPLWAHFKGIPFDLYTQEGLGRVGDLLGHPMEVDEFTRRMTNINVAHINCRVDCSKPLPTCGEIERDNGEVVTVTIEYPWVPPLCSCCEQLGHLISHCPSADWKSKNNFNASAKPAPPQAPSDHTSTASPMVELVEKAPEKIPRASPSEVPPGPRLEQVLPAGDSACEAPVDLGPSPPSNHAVEPSPNSDQFSDPISLDPDGSIISPPSSPRSPSSPRAPSPFDPNGLHPFSPPSSDSTSVPFNNDNPIPHPAKITHLLALPAVHHPRPLLTSTASLGLKPQNHSLHDRSGC